MGQAKFYYQDKNAPKPNKPNHIGTNAIIEYNGKLLLEHRADSEYWGLIGGGLKIDECLVDGIIREIKEETGMDIYQNQLAFYKIYDDPTRIASYPDGNVLRIISVVYLLKLTKAFELKCSCESRELKYFTIEEIKGLSIARSHMPILEDYCSKHGTS